MDKCNGFRQVIQILIMCVISRTTDSTCQLPASLIGQWNDVTRNAIVTFTSTQMLGWNLTIAGEKDKHVSQTCIKNTGNVYVFEGDEQYFDFPDTKSYYICMKLTEVSQNLYYYYLLADISHSEKIFTPSSAVNTDTSVTCDYCQYINEIPDTDFNLLQKLGTSESPSTPPSLCLPCENDCPPTTTPTPQPTTTPQPQPTTTPTPTPQPQPQPQDPVQSESETKRTYDGITDETIRAILAASVAGLSIGTAIIIIGLCLIFGKPHTSITNLNLRRY